MAMATNCNGNCNGDDDFVLLKCTDDDLETECFKSEITILASDLLNLDLTQTISNRIVTVKANRNRLIQHSSYFRGLLCGSFSESRLNCVSVKWDLETLMNILKFMFGYSVDITSKNCLPLFEGALFFGVEMILWKCKAWFIEETNEKGCCLMQIQLDDLILIWRFSVDHAIDFITQRCTGYLARNFMFAICCKSFPTVPSKLLASCIKHPDLTVESERHFADAIIGWITANAEQSESPIDTEDDYHIFLKEIRLHMLPLWFVAGKRRCCYFTKFAEESMDVILNLMCHPSTSIKKDSADNETHNLKIRLTQYTKKLDLSGCPQMKSKDLLESILPPPYSAETKLTTLSKQLSPGIGQHDGDQSPKSWSFGAVEEVEISNCPGLRLEAAVNCISKSFPFLGVLKAAHFLNFNQTNLSKLLLSYPLLTEVDLTVDISPLITVEVSNITSRSSIASAVSTASLLNDTYFSGSETIHISRPMHTNLSKLTLEGRIDVTDNDLKSISSFCASLSYLNLRGCTSVTDAGISILILRCSKLHSLLACGTSFGCISTSALMSDSRGLDFPPISEIGKNHCIKMSFKFQELHIGSCRGVDSTSFSKLMSQTPKLKSLCLREMQSVDEVLYGFLGSSLEMLDVTDTKVSSAALAHIVSRNHDLKCLRAKGCPNLYHQNSVAESGPFPSSEYSSHWFMELVKTCQLEEMALGWGFSSFSLEALKPAIATLRYIYVGMGATLGPAALELLPTICPLLESVILYFQVISDSAVMNLMASLRHLQVLSLCHCLGEISPVSFRFTMPNLRKLQLERVTPWMTNNNLVTLIQNCPNVVELFLIGCRLLNSDSQLIISRGWPGLISIHLEDCGEVTVNGISSLFECKAVEDILLRHTGRGIQRNFILCASAEMPMLRKVSVDVCDSVEGVFDIPDFAHRHHLGIVKIARCKPQRCSFSLHKSFKRLVHKETLVMVWDSKSLNRVVVKERL